MNANQQKQATLLTYAGLLPLVHVRFADDLAHATSAIES